MLFDRKKAKSKYYKKKQKIDSYCFVKEPLLIASSKGWSGGEMALGKLPVRGRPTIWITVGQGPTALVVGVGGFFWTFLLSSILFSPLSPSLWEAAQYRLKYCLKGPVSPKQPTNQPS